jgi:hypothetical protein
VGIGAVPGGAGRRVGVPGGNLDWQFVKYFRRSSRFQQRKIVSRVRLNHFGGNQNRRSHKGLRRATYSATDSDV